MPLWLRKKSGIRSIVSQQFQHQIQHLYEFILFCPSWTEHEIMFVLLNHSFCLLSHFETSNPFVLFPFKIENLNWIREGRCVHSILWPDLHKEWSRWFGFVWRKGAKTSGNSSKPVGSHSREPHEAEWQKDNSSKQWHFESKAHSNVWSLSVYHFHTCSFTVWTIWI